MQTGVAVFPAKITRRAASPTPQEKVGPTNCASAFYRTVTEEATPSLVRGRYRVLITAGLHVPNLSFREDPQTNARYIYILEHTTPLPSQFFPAHHS